MAETILIIEDDAAIRENTAELLELNKYHVITAEDGLSGYELARNGKPTIIICDLMMPGTNGHQFLIMVKQDESTKSIPLIFFSAGSMDRDIQEHLVPGKDHFLKKPFTEQELLNAINCSFLNREAV